MKPIRTMVLISFVGGFILPTSLYIFSSDWSATGLKVFGLITALLVGAGMLGVVEHARYYDDKLSEGDE